jgi:hypothetical protein
MPFQRWKLIIEVEGAVKQALNWMGVVVRKRALSPLLSDLESPI